MDRSYDDNLVPGRARNRKANSGLALVELLVTLVITTIIAGAMAFAFQESVALQRSQEDSRINVDKTNTVEQELRKMIAGARLGSSATDTTGFFVADSSSGTSDLGSQRITFTTTSPGIPMASSSSTDDFETQIEARGPIGGLTEVSFGTTPIGDAGTKTGLFERIQRPSDTDPTQGGNEFDLDDQIETIGFEFWDGQEWVDSWDTTTGAAHLPEAVQVSYTLKNTKETTPRMFVVAIPASDVSPENPDTNQNSLTSTTGVTG